MGDLLKGVHLLPQQDYEDALAENKIDDDVIYVTPEDFSSLAREQVERIDKNTEDIAANKIAIERNASDIISLNNRTTTNTDDIVLIQNTITDIILRDTTQDNRLKSIEDNYANKAAVVTIEDQQTITGPKTFVEHIYLANADGTVDRISHLNNNFIIHSGATNSAVLNIDEGLSKIYAFNKELAFKSDILDASGTLVTVGGVDVEELSFISDPQEQIDAVLASVPTKVSQLTNDSNYETTVSVDSKISAVSEEIQRAIDGLGTVFDLKGIKTSVSDLPTTGNSIGDVWYVTAEEVGYIWLNDGAMDRWERFGAPIDLSGYLPVSGGDVNFLNVKGDLIAQFLATTKATHETDTTAYNKVAIIKDNGYIRYRTKDELLTDIKALPLTGGVLTGTLQAPLFKSDESTAAFKLSAHNELNFGSNGSDMYIGYDSTRISDTNAKVSNYRFGDSNKNGNGGTIYCDKLYVNNGSQEVAVKADINEDAMRFAEEERQKSKNLLPGDADVDVTFVSPGGASAMLFSPHCWIYPTQASSSYPTAITFKKTNENEWYFSLNNRNVNEKVYFKFIDLKPNTTYTISFTPTSISGRWTFLKKSLVANTILNYTFTTNSNGEYDTKNDDAYFREGLADGISSMYIKNLQLEEGSTASSYMQYYGQIIHSTEMPNLYHHTFGLTVSGSNWRSYGINLMLPTHTKFTISTFAQWLYSKGYKSYNRNDSTGTCLWLSGSNFGAGGGYGTPLAVFSPDGSSVKVQISGSNTLSEDAVNTIVAYSVRDVFSDYIIS